MRKGLHPLIMIALVAAVTLFGRVLPTWTLSLATIAASNALIALGIVVLARTGNVSFGQGLFFAAGGYGEQKVTTTLDDRLQRAAVNAISRARLGGAQVALVTMRTPSATGNAPPDSPVPEPRATHGIR